MKGTTIVISVLMLLLGLGIQMVIKKYNDHDYTCQVLSITNEYHLSDNSYNFKSSSLDSIVKNGGTMYGVHVSILTKLDNGEYVANITKQNDILAARVICKKI